MRDCTSFPKRGGLVRGKLGPRGWREHGFGLLWSEKIPDRQVTVSYLRISSGFGNSIVLINFSVPSLGARTRNEKQLPPLLQSFPSQQNLRPLLAACDFFPAQIPHLTAVTGRWRALLLTTQCFLRADLNDNYRGELHQPQMGEKNIKQRWEWIKQSYEKLGRFDSHRFRRASSAVMH